MTTKEIGLLHGYLDGTISEAECPRLQELLRESPEARALLRTLATVDTRLTELGAGTIGGSNVPAPVGVEFAPQRSAGRTLSQWRPLAAAAAGLVIGLFSASMVFAYVSATGGKAISILLESFEVDAFPKVTGVPSSPDYWSGDYTTIVGESQGIKPASGKKMLQIRRADYEGKPPQFSYSGDLYRIIDLRGHEADLVDGKALVTVDASFQGIPFQPPNGYAFNLAVDALDALPTGGVSGIHRRQVDRSSPNGEELAGSFIPASAQRGFKFSPNGGGWQKARLELRVPPGTKYLLLSFHITDAKAAREGKRVYGETAVEFPGQFLDDIQVSLIRNVPVLKG